MFTYFLIGTFLGVALGFSYASLVKEQIMNEIGNVAVICLCIIVILRTFGLV